MKIALCQIDPTVGDFSDNKDKILSFYEKAKDLGGELIIFPELSITGYPPQDLLWDSEFIKKNMETLEAIAKATTVPMVVGCVRKEGISIYNSGVLCMDGRIVGHSDKVLLPTYDIFDEERYFTPGKGPSVLDLRINGKPTCIGLQICEDLWDSDYECKVTELQKKMGAQLIINISASPFHAGQLKERRSLIREKINSFGLPFVYCNLVGAQDELIFDGGSLAYDDSGFLVGQAKLFEEDIIVIDMGSCTESVELNPEKEELLHGALCLGVKDYFHKTGHTDAVIGLSGGIDSSLVGCIAVDALGKEHVHGISLPSRFSSEHSLEDARELSKNLGIHHEIIEIEDLVKEFEKVLEPLFGERDRDVTEENIQARTRGNILMALANKFGWLVLSTGNKTEMALGYCTLYGDMSGGLSVISDVSKTDVYALARWVNKKAGSSRIPVSCIEKSPSAELAPDQVDPFDYDIVSPLVDALIEKGKGSNALIKNGIDIELVNELRRRIRMNEYKRRQAAPGLRVSAKAFGSGRRIPIVNHFS